MRLRTLLIASVFMVNTVVYANSAEQVSLRKQIHILSETLNHSSFPDHLSQYHAYKAKMWLNYAENEISEHSLSGAGKEAVQYAQVLVDGLQNNQSLSLTTPILSTSQVMRRDLWEHIEYLKQHGAIEKAPESLAHAEIMLVWAAAEYCELGWRHSNELFKSAQNSLYQVMQATGLTKKDVELKKQLPSLSQLNRQGCTGVNAEFWPLIKIQPDTPTQHLTLKNVVHFAFDQAELSSESQKVLKQLIPILKLYPEMNIMLLGYTDDRASQFYNLQLAQRRIQSVQHYLLAQGIAKERIQSEAKGAKDLQTDIKPQLASAKSRRVVLQLSELEQIQVTLEPQWQDLQPEFSQKKLKVN